MPIDLPFGEYLPDHGALENPGSTVARNVVPIEGGYGPLPALEPLTAPIGNVIIAPNVINSATWVLTNINGFASGSVTNTTSTTDPAGGTTAEYIQEDATDGEHAVSLDAQACDPTDPVRLVIRAKANTSASAYRAIIRVGAFLSSGTSSGIYTFADLSAGTVSDTGQTGDGASAAASIEALTNSWYKVTLTGTVAASGTQCRVMVNLVSTGTTVSYQGITSAGAYLWGASLDPDTRCQGAISCQSLSETIFNFAGNATTLNQLDTDGRTWLNVTRVSGGNYAVPSDGKWTFAQFGNIIVATNGIDAVQAFTMGSSSAFAALAGSPPVATYCATWRNFLVLGNITSASQRVQWSPIGNPAGTWGTVAATQADYQDLGDGGPITGLHGDEVGWVWQTRQLTLATYEGPPTVWRFDPFAHAGCVAPGSLAKWADRTFWLAEDGLYALAANQLMPIGVGRTNRTLLADLNQSYYDRMSGAIDPVGGRYFLAYVSNNNSTGVPDKLMVYDWRRDKFTHADMDLELLLTLIPQAGYTLDSLDTISTSLDALPYSLDSRQWIGNARPLLGAFDTGHMLGATSGSPLAATIETMERQLFPGRRAMLRSARPILNGGVVTVTPGTRSTLVNASGIGTAVTWGNPVTVDSTGNCPMRSEGRYHRARVEIAAGGTWTRAQGLDQIEAVPGGSR